MSTGIGKSAVPIKTGQINNFTQPIFEIFTNPEVAKIALAIKRYQIANPTATRAEVARAMARYKTAYGDLKKKFDSGVKKAPLLSRPPPPLELYGRFGHAVPIRDIGTGSGTRLIPWVGHMNVTAIDTEEVLVPGVNKLRMLVEDYMKLPDAGGDHIYTSFLSATLWSGLAREFIFSRDGLHLTIDAPVCVRNRVAIRDGPTLRTNTSNGIVTENYFEHVGKPMGDYKIYTSFKQRDIVVTCEDPKQENYEFETFTYPVDYDTFDWSDCGWKFDGTMLELESHGGLAALSNRAGMVRNGVSSFKESFCLLLEHLENPEPVFVLVRILWWRGFTPPHSGDIMRQFCASVNIQINGTKVVASPQFVVGQQSYIGSLLYPNDGVISRSTYEDRDVYLKYQWTVDLTEEGVADLKQALTGRGLVMELTCSIQPGLSEYSLRLVGNVVRMSFVRVRKDRKRPTAVDTVLWYLETHDLGACLALNSGVV